MFGTLIRRRKQDWSGADERALETTKFSLTVDVPRPCDAVDGGGLDLLPMAKLIADYTQLLCRVRNISAGGLVAEAMSALPVGTAVQVELGMLQRIPARVVWTRDATLGIKFDADADLRAIFSNRPTRSGYRPRPPRLEIECGATVRLGRYFHKVQVRDISLGGIKVALAVPDCAGRNVVVTADSLHPVKGAVRWHKDNYAGIVFDKPLTFAELAEWLGKRLELASLRSGAWSNQR